MPPRDVGDEARILLGKATDDEIVLGKLAPDPEIADGAVGFHAQQAIEKAVKAVLAARGVAYEYTHDLVRLVAQLEGTPEFPVALEDAQALTSFAVEIRYGGLLGDEPLDRPATVELVRSVMTWARGTLGGEARNAASP